MKWNKGFVTFLLLGMTTFLLSGCSSNGRGIKQDGFFYDTVVHPFIKMINGLAEFFNGNYGLSIIVLTLIIRLILMPLVLRQYKNQQSMKEKMDLLKPEMDAIQKKLKQTTDPAKQQQLQMEMVQLYKKYNINPMSMGCLPIIIQMPILMGFYYAIVSSEKIASHTFLWFSLGEPDLILTALAGIVYFIQFKVSMANIPQEQQKQMKFMGLLSPVMIVIISLGAPAVLPLYWAVGGSFLIIQTMIGRKLYTPAVKTKPEKG